MTPEDLLDRLIAFDTVSVNPNLPLIRWVEDLLGQAGAEVTVIPDATGKKANLYATIGPRDRPGVLLSGHTDVVPVEGQDWTVPPFQLTRRDGRLFGRGTADMKGFVACAISAALQAAGRDLQTPLHLAFSHDEEIGCVGVHSMIEMLETAPFSPALCIIGEPTAMAVATGHKGKTGVHVTCTGVEGHSALAPTALNAIYLATDLITAIRDIQTRIARTGPRDTDYDVPYTTLHVGRINGGVALNIVPNECKFSFEIRNMAQDDPQAILNEVMAAADDICARHADQFPSVAIRFDVFNRYPGLSTNPSSEAVAFVKSLTGANGTIKVAFGTEGGLFSDRLGIPTVVCGPGSMAQGHKPDEFISQEQLDQCKTMLAGLIDRLEVGL